MNGFHFYKLYNLLTMLRIKLLFLIALYSVTGLMAQNIPFNQFDHWSIGLNDGIGGSMKEYGNIESFNSSGIRLQVKYSFDEYWGIMFLGGYNTFSTKSGIATSTKYVNTTLEAVYTLSNLYEVANDNFELLIHAGPGLGTFWSTNITNLNPSDPFFKNQDDIINVNVGFSPQYTISQNVHLNLDFSYSFNFKQDHAFDYTAQSGKTATIYNLSAGVNFTLRKKIVKMNLIF